MIVGYGRVSTVQQDYEGQLAALKAAGVDKVFVEKISGAVTDRQQLAKAIASLGDGDVLVVTKLDRLARSNRDLLNILATVADKGAGFKVLDNPAMDTTQPYGRLLVNFLGAIAEFERSMILSRTSEGRRLAKERGQRFGRKPKLTGFQRDEALRRREAGETLTDIARSMNVSHSTISRL
jgi:DNA invertase Pin-like site-specific DNA recombinase